MTNVKFSRKDFESGIGEEINEEIEKKISLFGTPLESLTDDEVEVEIFPNRPDLISIQGFLRSFNSFLGKNPGLKKYNIKKPGKDFEVIIDSSVEKVRPYTVCAIVKGLDLDSEKIKNIIDLQEKLHATVGRNRKKVAIGIYPLDKIKLPITYKAMKPKEIIFRPLEYDGELNGDQILKKHPTGKEYAHLLEGCDVFPVFVDSENKVLSMPPIINSHETGRVTEETKELFVECSGSHFETLKKTLNIIVSTLADMDGEIYSMKLKYGKSVVNSPDFTPEKIKISLENVNKILGTDLKQKEFEKLLGKMGQGYEKGHAVVSPWRSDILHEVDIIEDVAIAYGYDNFEPEISEISTEGFEDKNEKIKRKISEILTGIGLLETSSYHLIKKEEAKMMHLKNAIELEESKTEYKFLRGDLLTSSLRILAENKDKEYPQKTFELGAVFSKDFEGKTETGINEIENLVIVLTPSNFTETKQVLDYLMRMLSLEYKLEETEVCNFIQGRTGEIFIEGKSIGHIGEIHPEVIKSWNLRMAVSAVEISLDKLFSHLMK